MMLDSIVSNKDEVAALPPDAGKSFKNELTKVHAVFIISGKTQHQIFVDYSS